MISVWPLESEENVIHEDLFYNFLDHLYGSEGVLKPTDLSVDTDTNGIGVRIAPGAAVVAYDGVPGGKRVIFNSALSKSGPNMYPNASFTVNLQHWETTGGATLVRETASSANYHSAPASGKITTSGASSWTQGIRNPFSVAAECRIDSDTDQEISCWMKAPVGTQVRLAVREMTAAYGQLGDVIGDAYEGTGAWTKIYLRWKSSSTAKFFVGRVQIQCNGVVDVYVDDFSNRLNTDWDARDFGIGDVGSFQIGDDTNPRVDRVGIILADSKVPGSSYTEFQKAKFVVIPGTPTSGANLTNLSGAAAIPNNFLLLANVVVGVNSTGLGAGDIDTTVRKVSSLNVNSHYSTSFPTTGLFDGMEVTIVDSISNPGYIWHFRYNAGSSSAYKWEFIGGSPIRAEITTSETTTSTSYTALTTAGPTITVPFNGTYIVTITAEVANSTSGGAAAMSYDIGATGASEADRIIAVAGSANAIFTLYREKGKADLVAGNNLTSKYRAGGAGGTATFLNRRMHLIPIRVQG